MLDNISIPCFFFFFSGNILDCNQQIVNLFGCSDKEDFLKSFYYLSPKYQSDGSQSRDKIKEIVERVINTDKRLLFHWDHIKKDGTLLPSEISTIRVAWKNEYRAIVCARDLSELVETEDNLRRVLATAEASPNATIFIGVSGNIEYINPAISAVSGFSQEEIMEKGLALIFSPEDFERLYKKHISAALRDHPEDFEITLLTKKREKLDFFFSAFSVELYGGSVGVGLVGRDITEQKHVHHDLALARDQAERALEAEMKYNQAKSDFLSRVSHELRTPLNAIIGMSGIARKTNDKDELEHCHAKIEEASENLLWLINGILDLSSIDTDKFDFTLKPFSFNSIMSSIVENITVKNVNVTVKNASVKDETVKDNEMISIDEFAKIKLKTAKVIAAEAVPKSKKLLKLQVKIGEEQKQILAGVAEHYKPEDLINKTIVVVANLRPAKLMGLDSEGMMLCASTVDKLFFITPNEEIDDGAEVR
jgi:methionine--tRNA ligase beta chain